MCSVFEENKDRILSYIKRIQTHFPSYLTSLTYSEKTVFSDSPLEITYIDDLEEQFEKSDLPLEEQFSSVKYSFDNMFLTATLKGKLIYEYSPSFLISKESVMEALHWDDDAFNKRTEKYFEKALLNNEYFYPKHVIYQWKPGVNFLRFQLIQQFFLLRDRTTEEVINDLKRAIKKFQKKYGGTFEETIKDIPHPDELDEPFDYYEWGSLEEELRNLIKET